jgi:NAD(P)-dependent dehydrogenase (short-subunit alcohol dehydrogenase family)
VPCSRAGERPNLIGTYRCVRAAQHVLAPGAERRVVVSSILARIGVPGYTDCASKTGLLGLVRSLAAELARDNAQVNAICPGWVDTDMAWAGHRPVGASRGDHARRRATGRRCARCRCAA